jgi:hypothetical protein
MHKFWSSPIVRILVALVAIGALVLVVYLRFGMPAPDERYRVGPATGEFSIIIPPDWSARVMHEPSQKQYLTVLNASPKKIVGMEQSLKIGRLRIGPTLEQLKTSGLLPLVFQDRPAFGAGSLVKHDFIWRMLFERSGQWFELILVLRIPEDVPQSDWWPYLESFRSASPGETPATAPSTKPTTKPSATPVLQ